MEIDPGVRFRSVRPEDASAIGRLHADSWRRHYRGAYADSFLDGHVTDVLTQMWTERLATPLTRADTVLAEDGNGVAGFAHTWFDGDRAWGALLDNLHVRFDLKGRGIGTLLMGLAARAVHDWSPSTGLCLWVLEQNVDAQAFYSARDVCRAGNRAAARRGPRASQRATWLSAVRVAGHRTASPGRRPGRATRMSHPAVDAGTLVASARSSQPSG